MEDAVSPEREALEGVSLPWSCRKVSKASKRESRLQRQHDSGGVEDLKALCRLSYGSMQALLRLA